MEKGIRQVMVGREPFAGFPPPNAYLVSGADASILIDTGWEGEADHDARMAAIAEAGGAPLSRVVLTHRHADHAGGALRLREATGAPLACHPLEREVIEGGLLGGAGVDEVVEGGERYDLGGLTAEVLFAPGHTLGCLAVYVPERGALFASDTVMAISTTVVRPGEGDLAQYAATLERLSEVGAATIYAGHGPPVRDPGRRLASLMEHRRQREEALLAALADGSHTVIELRDAVYGRLSEPRQPLASAQVVSMLAKLEAEGAAARADDGERWERG